MTLDRVKIFEECSFVFFSSLNHVFSSRILVKENLRKLNKNIYFFAKNEIFYC